MRTVQIMCERPGAEYRRRLIPDVGHHRDCLVAGDDEVRPSPEDLDLVRQFAARLRAERERAVLSDG